jgi:hypothetical protein
MIIDGLTAREARALAILDEQHGPVTVDALHAAMTRNATWLTLGAVRMTGEILAGQQLAARRADRRYVITEAGREWVRRNRSALDEITRS